MEFKELKKTITDQAKKHSACIEEYKRALSAKSKKTLLQVIKDNFNWCYQKKVVTVDLLKQFGIKLCEELDIYFQGEKEVLKYKSSIIMLGDFKCKMLGNSTVTKMWDNSTVTKMWDNSTVTKMWDNSTVTKMWDNSTVTKMWDNSTVTKMLGNSIARSYNGNLPEKTIENVCYVDLINNKIYIGEGLTVVPKK